MSTTFDAHANFALSSVAVAPSPPSSGTTLTVATGQGALFPTAPYNCTVQPVAPYVGSPEIVRVTGRVGDVMTIVRAQEGTSARSILVGDLFANTITVKDLTDIESAVNGVNGIPSGGAKFARLAKNSTTNYDAGWYGPDTFNVLDYGADPTGAADSYAAFAAAITALNAAGGGTLWMPEGTYKLLTAPTTITKPCQILGGGMGVTTINCTGSINGFKFDFSSTARACATAQGFTINTTAAGTQTAIYYRQTNNSGVGQPFLFSDIEFGPAWSVSLDIANQAQNNSQGGEIRNLFIRGSTSATLPVAGIRVKGSSNITISDCRIFEVTKGIIIDGSILCEGVKVRNTDIVNCWYGIDSGGTDTEITNCYVNVSLVFGSYGIGFYLRSTANQSVIMGCYATTDDPDSFAIYLGGAGSCRISECLVLSTSASRWSYGVDIDTGNGNIVHDCIIANVTNSAVYVGAGAANNKIHDISFNDIIGATAINSPSTTSRIYECFGLGSNTDSSWDTPYWVYATWNPANLAPTQQDFLNVTVPGAAFGMGAVLAPPYDLQNMIATAQVSAANTVRITLTNSSSGSVDLGSGSWGVKLVR